MGTVFVREDVCIGCGLCQVYCLTEHSQSKDIIKAYKQESPKPVPRVHLDRWEDKWLSVQCRHCEEPWCVYSCLTGAMTKDPVSGIVQVDAEKCMGCWTCMLVCPYGVLSRDKEQAVAVKCDLCPGHEIPVCVANCPNEALLVSSDDKAELSQPA